MYHQTLCFPTGLGAFKLITYYILDVTIIYAETIEREYPEVLRLD